VKILWVKANKLLPIHSGGDIRSFNIARRLSIRHELAFFSYYDGLPDGNYDAELPKHFPRALSVCTGKSDSGTIKRGLDYLLHLPVAAPYAVSRFASAVVRRQLQGWFDEQRFDVAVCDFLDAAVNFPKKLTIPTVLFQHNVETEIWRRHAETESNPIRKMIYRMEFAKMLRYEQKIVREYQHVIAVSENDKKLMSQWTDESRIAVVPTGVDLRQYRPEPVPREVGPLVMFVGAMDWEPNIDAVEYFCDEIWSQVLAAVPEARFRIVGRNPDRRVQKFASSSVEVTGRVASVIDHLRDAAVVIVPLRIGGGTRLKIYEAMAAGKAVVSTSIGAEGLDVNHGRDILLADTQREFAESIIRFLRDRQLRSNFERAAAELAVKYDWSAIGDKFSVVLEAVAENRTHFAEQYAHS